MRAHAAAADWIPQLDTEVDFNLYSAVPSPVDNSVWGVAERFPGYLVRVDRGNESARELPCRSLPRARAGLRSARRRRRQQRRRLDGARGKQPSRQFRSAQVQGTVGRKIDGSECREGWTLYQTNGPRLKGTDIPADFHYYNWVDQHDILGLGANRPMATGSNSDSLLVLDPQTREWITMRVPYPLGFYSRGMDGRIDDPNAGWKGRALYANYGTHFVWHIEGGKGTKGKARQIPASSRSARAMSDSTRSMEIST